MLRHQCIRSDPPPTRKGSCPQIQSILQLPPLPPGGPLGLQQVQGWNSNLCEHPPSLRPLPRVWVWSRGHRANFPGSVGQISGQPSPGSLRTAQSLRTLPEGASVRGPLCAHVCGHGPCASPGADALVSTSSRGQLDACMHTRLHACVDRTVAWDQVPLETHT